MPIPHTGHMRFMDLLRPAPSLLHDAARLGGTQIGLASPWTSDSHLANVLASDILGLDAPGTTRLHALKVPAIAKGRALIAGTLSRYPLRKLRNGQQVEADGWMTRSDTGQDPHARMLWTFDDLIFYGASLWLVTRGNNGQILDAARVPVEDWSVDADGYIQVNGTKVPKDNAILIPGPQEGLLTIAANSIRGALALENAWIQRATSPVPMVELKITDQNLELTQAEKQALADQWEAQRKKGGTAVVPYGLELRTHGQVTADLFIQGRNAIRLDIANYLNVPSNLLEGAYATASLTYSTSEGKRNELVDYSLRYWAGAVEARLSQDDVVPRGSAVEFDLEWLETTTGESPHRMD